MFKKTFETTLDPLTHHIGTGSLLEMNARVASVQLVACNNRFVSRWTVVLMYGRLSVAAPSRQTALLAEEGRPRRAARTCWHFIRYTPLVNEPLPGNPHRHNQHATLAQGVRRKEFCYIVIEKGQPCRPSPDRVRHQVDLPADDPGF